MASAPRRGRAGRLVRAADRALLGAFMAMVALVLERRLRKALRRSGGGSDANP